MIAGRVSQFIGRMTEGIGEGKTPEEIQKLMAEALLSFLSISGRVTSDAVEVTVGESKEQRDRYDVYLSIRPDRAGLGYLPPVALNLRIRR